MKLSDRVKARVKQWFDAPGIVSTFVQTLGSAPESSARQVLEDFKGVVYQAITTNTTNISQMENYIAVLDNKGKVVKKNYSHPFFKLLENPNPDTTKKEFLESIHSFKQMVGEYFIYFEYGEVTKKPKAMYVLRPDRVRVVIGKEGTEDAGKVIGYNVAKEGNPNGVDLNTYEVYHGKMFNPLNPYRGLGPLQAGIKYVNTEKYATEFSMNALYNNATPAGVLTVDKDMSDDAYKMFKRRWSDTYTGTKNVGKIAIVRGGTAEFTKVGLALSDIDLKELKNMSEESILRMFKVPKELTGFSDTGGLGRAGIETLEYIYMKRTIDPEMSKYDDDFQKIIKRFYKEDVKVKHENVIPEDKEYELNRKDKGVDRWLTRDEIRAEEGLEAKGADSLFVEFNKTPLESSTQANQSKTLKIKITGKEEETKPVEKVFDTKDKSESQPHEIFRKNTIDNSTEVYTVKTIKEIKKFLATQEEKVLSTLPKKATAKDLANGFDPQQEGEEMASLILRLLLDLANEIGTQANEFAGGDGNFELTASAIEAIKGHIKRASIGFNEELAQQIANTLAEGVLNNESTGELKKRIKSEYEQAKSWKNERLARNENHWTTVKSTEDAYYQLGIKYKQWYANPGACEYCQSADGRIEATGDKFFELGAPVDGVDGGKMNVTYEPIDTANLHPNCRCTVLPVNENKSLNFNENIKLKSIPLETIQDRITLGIEDKICEHAEHIVEKAVEKVSEKVDQKVKDFEKQTDKLKEILDNDEQEKNNQS